MTAAGVALVTCLIAQLPDGTPSGVDLFEQRVRPVLVERCFECHGPRSEEKGGLRLDSRAGLLAGGRRGPAIEPGRPGESLLVSAIQDGRPLRMPPEPHAALSVREVTDIAAWVRLGAPWPAGAGAAPADKGEAPPAEEEARASKADAEGRAFWAFLPPAEPAVPEARDAERSRSPLDRFILRGLEDAGLEPAPPASRRTLIRRVMFDLTGLPPTPDEVAAFLADEAPDALERLADRLLASPRYGERWGRHWLDVARYADSNGMDENLAQASAYRYRDYVIDAFNRDKPFDVFLEEQLAGDLLEAEAPAADERARLDRLVATGFLALGPKMLAEDDPRKMELDIIDEQVDTVGRAFLGLTLGCARCHDHKFDPITQVDYYGLAGIFKSTRTMESFSVVARWLERPVGSREAIEAAARAQESVAATKREIDSVTAAAVRAILEEARERVDEYVGAAGELARSRAAFAALVPALESPRPDPKAGSSQPGPSRSGASPDRGETILLEAEDFVRGNVLRDRSNYGAGIGVLVNAGPLPNVAEYDVEAPAGGVHQLDLRYAAAEARPVRLLVDGALVHEGAAGGVTGSWTPESQRWEVAAVIELRPGKRTIRLERDGPFPHIDKLAITPLQGLRTESREGANAAKPLAWRAHGRVAAERGLQPGILAQWLELFEKQGLASAQASALAEAVKRAIADPAGPLRAPPDIERSFPREAVESLASLRARQKRLEESMPTLPAAMGVSEGAVEDLRVHLRGNYLNLGDEAPRRFPAALVRSGQPLAKDRSGRLELARWLTSRDHPLTARVLVNRIWRWRFGAGLVRSVDNFGRLGERPTHPALLDWLARRVVESGWSVKRLHRALILSATYSMGSRAEPSVAGRCLESDPENRFRWRWSRRRLEAEELRDAILATSGGLDLAMGGSLLKTENRAYVTSTANIDTVKYGSERRSVYLPIIRSALFAMLQAFDFPDPSSSSGDRATTVVTPQALFLMNSDLVRSASERLAARWLAAGEPYADRGAPADARDAARLTLAHEGVLGRPPSAVEVEEALEFLRTYAEAVERADPAKQGAAGADQRASDPGNRAERDLPAAAAEARRRAWEGLARVLLSSNEALYVD